MQSTFRVQSPMKEYKRRSDGKTVRAQLLKEARSGGVQVMRIEEDGGTEHRCPECKVLFSLHVHRHEKVRVSYLEVTDFHARHKPLDTD